MFSSNNNNNCTQCRSASDSPSSTTCRASCSQHTIQPNTSGFSDLGNHDFLASDFTGTSLDFAFAHGNSSPDLLASFTDPYHPLPSSSVPDPFFNGEFNDIFAGLQNDPLLFALDGATAGSNYSDESPDNLFSQPNMYNESFLAATLNPTTGLYIPVPFRLPHN